MKQRSQKPIGRRAFLMGSAGGVLAAGSGNFAPLLGLGPRSAHTMEGGPESSVHLRRRLRHRLCAAE